MKYIHFCTLFPMLVLLISCRQSETKEPPDNISKGNYAGSQLINAATSTGPMSMVRKVRQASNGDILIAACTGVFRYDGKSFTNITSEIPTPCFWDVLEDRKGNLWFASKDSGVYYYNGKSIQRFTTKDGLASNIALHICEDKSGNIWFSTGGGISRYDGKSFRNFTTKDGLPDNGVHSVMEDRTGKLWIGTSGDACFYDGKTFTKITSKDGKAFKNVWGITEDKKGNIWFGDVDGLWRYEGNTFTKISQKGVYAIIEDKKGNIWTTGPVNPSDGSVWALSRYDARTLYDKMPTVKEIKSGGPALLGLMEANDGSIWFGGLGPHIGVQRYDGKTFTDFKSTADQ